MEVVAGAGAGGPDVADKVALVDIRTFLDRYLVHVGISGLVAVAVIDLDEVAVSAVASGESHLTVSRGVYRGHLRRGQVYTLVGMLLTCNGMNTGTERRGYAHILRRLSAGDRGTQSG